MRRRRRAGVPAVVSAGRPEIVGAIIGAIVAVWALLLVTAFVARVRLRLRPAASAGAVLAVYLCLCGAALRWFGATPSGALAAFGMSLPCACALLLTRVRTGV